MMCYTLVPWLLGYTLPVYSNIDISILTWTLVCLSLISSSLWFVMQIGFLLIGKAIIDASFHIRESVVSIIIPARNEESVINRTISSCLAQTYENIEILVICHNCTDKTYLAASKSNDRRVRVFDLKTHQAGKGLALDYGMEQSRGSTS